jgi:hypothetical protein
MENITRRFELKSNFGSKAHGREVMINEKLAEGKRCVDIDCLILYCLKRKEMEGRGAKKDVC